jgi:hypothetical protein
MLNLIRIPEEKELFDKLWNWLAADTILKLMGKSNSPYPRKGQDLVLDRQAWPIKKSLPELRQKVDKVIEKLSMQNWEINFILQGGNAPLALSRIVISENGEMAEIVLSSKQLAALSDDEKLAVIAHELAHIAFGHAKLQLCIDWIDLASKQGRLYALANLSVYWRQLAEISADRASLLVVDDPATPIILLARQRIEDFTSELDVAEFLGEANDSLAQGIKQNSRQESHPPLIVRALALEAFRISSYFQSLRNGSMMAQDDSHAVIADLTEHLKISPSSHAQFLEFSFLMTAGNYLIQADSDIHNVEVMKLRDILAKILHAPDDSMVCLKNNEVCKKCLSEIGEQLVSSYPAKCEEVFKLLCILVVQDGRVTPSEERALGYIANALALPDATMARIILNTLRQEFHPEMHPESNGASM